MDNRIIFLTDWLPLTIRHSDWPVQVASLEYSARGEFAIRVRESREGRLLVYATHGSHITGETYGAAGELLNADVDVQAAIRRVGEACKVPGSLIDAAIRELAGKLAA